MDSSEAESEMRSQARDLRRERADWCREKLGVNPLDWLPAVGERERVKEANMQSDPITETWKEFKPAATDLAPPGYAPITCSVCGLRMGWTDERGGIKMLCRECRHDLFTEAPGRDDA